MADASSGDWMWELYHGQWAGHHFNIVALDGTENFMSRESWMDITNRMVLHALWLRRMMSEEPAY